MYIIIQIKYFVCWPQGLPRPHLRAIAHPVGIPFGYVSHCVHARFNFIFSILRYIFKTVNR